ncbi:MAG: bifunctional folylpolyglutamate synthase/dihydrofolate synthase [Flavobacteriales bacterium]|nr:bifunctional folylpolyglutamate synthase/dihydrofolate synthase [Flavobacteriales bacterium]
MTYEQTLDYQFKQLPMYQREGKKAFKKDLSNTLALCSILEQPEQQFKSIHIAGTNGKGSTAHMLSSVLQEAGYKTGLYTSPHLKDFRERIRVNGQMISKEEVIEFVHEFQAKFAAIHPSFFEWTVVLAFHIFAKEKVDIAVIETGLGGRLDSTNVINPELSIITNIGFDHIDLLGDTLEKIATEKAGIIKTNTPVVVVNHSGQKDVFAEKAAKERAPITFSDELEVDTNLTSDLKGNYQAENIKGIYTVYLKLKEMGWNISMDQLQNGLQNVGSNTQLRGRWDILQHKPTIIADTAHNKEGLKLALHQLKTLNADQLHFVIGFVKDKNIEEILQLFPKSASYYFCEAKIPRALNHVALHEKATQIGLKGNSFTSVVEALSAAKREAQTADIIYVGGSSFVVAEVV